MYGVLSYPELSILSKNNTVIGYEITTTGAIQLALKQFV